MDSSLINLGLAEFAILCVAAGALLGLPLLAVAACLLVHGRRKDLNPQ